MEGDHFCPSVMICGMFNSAEIEFGWNHVVVLTTICCSAHNHMSNALAPIPYPHGSDFLTPTCFHTHKYYEQGVVTITPCLDLIQLLHLVGLSCELIATC